MMHDMYMLLCVPPGLLTSCNMLSSPLKKPFVFQSSKIFRSCNHTKQTCTFSFQSASNQMTHIQAIHDMRQQHRVLKHNSHCRESITGLNSRRNTICLQYPAEATIPHLQSFMCRITHARLSEQYMPTQISSQEHAKDMLYNQTELGSTRNGAW